MRRRASTGNAISYNVVVPKNKIIQGDPVVCTALVRTFEKSDFLAPTRCRVDVTEILVSEANEVELDRVGSQSCARVWCSHDASPLQAARATAGPMAARQSCNMTVIAMARWRVGRSLPQHARSPT
jgi:hypothetical protein